MTQKSVYFSVIICNYNYARFIAEAISSVLAQTFADFELIVVDDGSTDNSKEIISGISDTRIKTVFQANGGQAAAFNAGVAIAKGEYICFLDSDDWWKKNKLERLKAYIEVTPDNVAIYQHLLLDSLQGENKVLKHIIPSGDVLGEMKQSRRFDFFVPTSSLCIPRWVSDQVFPMPEEMWFSADAFIMRAAIVHGILFSIPEVLGYHRLHENSFTSGILQDNTKMFELVVPLLNAYYKEHNVDYEIRYWWRKPKPSRWQKKKKSVRQIVSGIKSLVK